VFGKEADIPPRTENGGGGRLRFGDYSFDRASGVLRKNDQPVKLQPQPANVLRALIEKPGQVITREALRDCVWGNATYVNFDQGLNFCIRQIRVALDENARQPRFIETLPRQGYRFVARIETEHLHQMRRLPWRWILAGGGLALVVLAMWIAIQWRSTPDGEGCVTSPLSCPPELIQTTQNSWTSASSGGHRGSDAR